jgi:hypothetical protein
MILKAQFIRKENVKHLTYQSIKLSPKITIAMRHYHIPLGGHNKQTNKTKTKTKTILSLLSAGCKVTRTLSSLVGNLFFIILLCLC